MNSKRGLFGSNRKRTSRSRSGRVSDWFLLPVRVYGWIPESVATVLILLLFLTASWMIVRWIMDEARMLPVFTVDPATVRCSARPEWLDMSSDTAAEIMYEIESSLSRLKPETIFDDTFLHLLRKEVCKGCPWVEDITAVERDFPSQVRIRLELRRPAAVFFRRDRAYFVDDRGVVITSFVPSRASGSQGVDGGLSLGLAVIRGIDLTAAPRAGQVFPDRALVEGAAVAAEVSRLEHLLGDDSVRIRTIDVSGYGRGLSDDTVLITSSGARLLWGRSESHAEFRGIDPSVEKKAENLKRVLKERPGLDGVAEVKLTFDKPAYTLKVESLTGD